MTAHRCPGPGCTRMVGNHIFACRTHWFRVSPPTRRAIYATKDLPLTDGNRWRIVQDAIREMQR